MSLSFDAIVTMRVTADAFFAAFGDMADWPAWMRSNVTAECLTPGEFGVGTQWRETERRFGRESSEIFEVTQWDPPRRVEVFVDGSRGTTGCGEFRFRCDVEPRGNLTEVRMHGEITMPGLFRHLMARLFFGSFRKACVRDLHALKTHLEAKAARPA